MASLNRFLLAFACNVCLLGVQALELTADNWNTKTDGKLVFLNYYSPECQASKNLLPEWEGMVKQSDLWDGTVIAEVDCKGRGKELCEAQGIKVFPTIKFGDPNNLNIQKEVRGKTSQDLQQLLAQVPKVCTPTNLQACTSEERAIIKTFQDMEQWELKSLMKDCTYEPPVDGLWRRDTTYAFASFQGAGMFPNTEQECARRCCELPDCTAWVMSKAADKPQTCDLVGAVNRNEMRVWNGVADGIEGSSAKKQDPTSTMFAGNSKAHLAYGYLRAVYAHHERKANKDEL